MAYVPSFKNRGPFRFQALLFYLNSSIYTREAISSTVPSHFIGFIYILREENEVNDYILHVKGLCFLSNGPLHTT